MAVTPDTHAVVRFAQYEIDLREQVVRLNGVSVAIQDKPLQLLLALLERPGQLISREELRNRLWPTDAFGAFEDGLNTAVRKLRIALNDSAETPQFIETVPRRGYRFIAPVSVVTQQQETAAEPVAPVAMTKPRVGMRWLAAGVVVAMIIGGLWGGATMVGTKIAIAASENSLDSSAPACQPDWRCDAELLRGRYDGRADDESRPARRRA